MDDHKVVQALLEQIAPVELTNDKGERWCDFLVREVSWGQFGGDIARRIPNVPRIAYRRAGGWTRLVIEGNPQTSTIDIFWAKMLSKATKRDLARGKVPVNFTAQLADPNVVTTSRAFLLKQLRKFT